MKEAVSAEGRVREIRRKTRKKDSAEVKVRIALEALRGEESIAVLRRWERISSNLYYGGARSSLRPGRSDWPETQSGKRNRMIDRTAPGERATEAGGG